MIIFNFKRKKQLKYIIIITVLLSLGAESLPKNVYASPEQWFLTNNVSETDSLSERTLELKNQIETTYDISITIDSFSESQYAAFRDNGVNGSLSLREYYSDMGITSVPDTKDDYVYSLLMGVANDFTMLPNDIVTYMNSATEFNIYIELNQEMIDNEFDGMYYPAIHGIILMYSSDPFTHEYGHFILEGLGWLLGEDEIERQWTPLNSGFDYTYAYNNSWTTPTSYFPYIYAGDKQPDEGYSGTAQNSIFYSEYAATELIEDMAETFYMAIKMPEDIVACIQGGSPLGKKALMLMNWIYSIVMTASPEQLNEIYMLSAALSESEQEVDNTPQNIWCQLPLTNNTVNQDALYWYQQVLNSNAANQDLVNRYQQALNWYQQALINAFATPTPTPAPVPADLFQQTLQSIYDLLTSLTNYLDYYHGAASSSGDGE